jgi:hypothetical protein
VLRHARAFFRRRFGDADFQAPVELHGIDGEQFRAPALSQAQRDGAFAAGRGADQQGQRIFVDGGGVHAARTIRVRRGSGKSVQAMTSM